MTIAGIDPGISGGITILGSNTPDTFATVKMPTQEIKNDNVIDADALYRTIKGSAYVFTERVHSFPGR